MGESSGVVCGGGVGVALGTAFLDMLTSDKSNPTPGGTGLSWGKVGVFKLRVGEPLLFGPLGPDADPVPLDSGLTGPGEIPDMIHSTIHRSYKQINIK